MGKERCLPFPRGRTLSQAGGDIGELSLDDDKFSGWEGRIFEVDDSVHGTGETVRLRCVKNDTSGDITVARKFAEFGANAGDFGKRIGDFPGTNAGFVCKPLDDAYVVGFTIPEDDLFWVVESGPCSVLTNGDTLSLTAGDALAMDTDGLVSDDPAAAGEFVVGQSDITTTSATAITLLVHVNEGLANANA